MLDWFSDMFLQRVGQCSPSTRIDSCLQEVKDIWIVESGLDNFMTNLVLMCRLVQQIYFYLKLCLD